MSAGVRVEVADGYVHLVLDEPARRNPLSRARLAELRDALRTKADGVNAVVLSGAGTAFSAGADLTELTGTAADEAVDDAIAEAVHELTHARALTVAAVEGPCRGAAVDVVLGCDVVLAGASATFEVPAVRLGIMYNPDAVRRWAARLPRATLVRLLLGEQLDASQARAGGLVAEVVPTGSAVSAATELAQRMAQLPPTVVAAVKELLVDLDDGADLTEAHLARRDLLASPDRLDALRTIREGRNG
ncbi:MAG: hypothetical protein GEV07_27870 [Streptosporangiales bacterium]|nr:hypothetical protein [Streptosporangiales bacterium]